MRLAEIVLSLPEPTCGCDSWSEHALHLWAEDPAYMLEMLAWMKRTGDWPGDPVVVDDGYVQDGHHRIVLALSMGWLERDVPCR